MFQPFQLGLRHNRHMVSVVKPAGRTREVLGVAYPDDSNPRLRILAQWGIDARSPRIAELATIDIPLPRRAQAILSYQVNPDLRERLNTGMGPPSGSRLHNQPGMRARVHLGETHVALPVCSRLRSRPFTVP